MYLHLPLFAKPPVFIQRTELGSFCDGDYWFGPSSRRPPRGFLICIRNSFFFSAEYPKHGIKILSHTVGKRSKLCNESQVTRQAAHQRASVFVSRPTLPFLWRLICCSSCAINGGENK
ncbi:hypothetical protein CRV24_008898 [Beauveria bassiana]|nr:hypothetical protein CRV24_008898 [Beauveria bassiana]